MVNVRSMNSTHMHRLHTLTKYGVTLPIDGCRV
jgi:hypothetical protein